MSQLLAKRVLWGLVVGLGVMFAQLHAAPRDVEPSEFCGQCHQTIYETWALSGHARAMKGDAFLRAFRETETSQGMQLAGRCLECHAPLVRLTGDRELAYQITWEGVNCEACHSLVSVRLSDSGPRSTVRLGQAQRGPNTDASSDAHPVTYSELHTTSLACAWCHEYVNPEGTPILTTFSEWSGSQAAAEGMTCQSCHMGLTRTNVSEPRSERIRGTAINLHHVPGGHSLQQLNEALALAIESRRAAEQLTVELHITNKGAGHAVPTGMPGRRVVLDCVVRGAQQRYSEQRVYGKLFVDAAGRQLTRDRDYFATGVKLDQDSRIQPDEHRIETFAFPIPITETAYLTVRLHYEHAPMGSEEGREWLTFLSEKRTLMPE